MLLALACALAASTTAGSALVLPWREGLHVLATVGFVLAAGSALAAGLGFLLRTTAGALVSLVVLLLVLPGLLPQLGAGWPTTLADALPGSAAVFLLTGEPARRGFTQTSATLTLLAWAVGAVLLGRLRLTRADVGS